MAVVVVVVDMCMVVAVVVECHSVGGHDAAPDAAVDAAADAAGAADAVVPWFNPLECDCGDMMFDCIVGRRCRVKAERCFDVRRFWNSASLAPREPRAPKPESNQCFAGAPVQR